MFFLFTTNLYIYPHNIHLNVGEVNAEQAMPKKIQVHEVHAFNNMPHTTTTCRCIRRLGSYFSSNIVLFFLPTNLYVNRRYFRSKGLGIKKDKEVGK